jgi:hypothetical protein
MSRTRAEYVDPETADRPVAAHVLVREEPDEEDEEENDEEEEDADNKEDDNEGYSE